MIYTNTKLSLYTFLTAFLLSLSASMFSQEIRQYEGDYVVGPYKGEATFGYKLVDNDTVLDGAFQMSRSNLEELLEQEDSSFSFTGAFRDNYPEGNWKFSFGEFQSEKESQVVDYQYRVSVSGIQEEAYGTLVEGKLDGLWICVVDSIAQSEVDKTLFKSSIEYEDGVPQKSFRIENEQFTLVGRCLRNGLAHDQWTLYATDGSILESWYFENGILNRIDKGLEDQRTSLPMYKGPIEGGKQLSIGDQYLKILQIKAFTVGSIKEFESKLYGLIAENAAYYHKIDNILAALGESRFLASFKVEVDQFPLVEEESKLLDSVQIDIKRAADISQSILSNTQLNIIRLSDPEASFYYEVVNELSSSFVKPIEKLIEYREDQIIQAVSREELLAFLWPEGLPSASLSINGGEAGEEETFEGPGVQQTNFSELNLGTVFQMAQYANSSLDSIRQILSTKLNIEKRQQELIQIEDQLISQAKRVDQLIDSLKTVTSGQVRESLEKIKTLSKDNLSTYSAIEEEEEKLSYGRQLLTCLELMEELANKIGALPAQGEEIRETYIDDIWNPHMAVIMKDAVKKRITAAYQKIIVPDVLENIQANLNCDNAGTYSDMLKSLYQRMLEMREEDTSKLERKLKKEEDPKEILRMFNVEPIYTD